MCTVFRKRQSTTITPSAPLAGAPQDWEPLALSYLSARLEAEALKVENDRLRAKLREAIDLLGDQLVDVGRLSVENDVLASIALADMAEQITAEGD
jgi:hypothetical protein